MQATGVFLTTFSFTLPCLIFHHLVANALRDCFSNELKKKRLFVVYMPQAKLNKLGFMDNQLNPY